MNLKMTNSLVRLSTVLLVQWCFSIPMAMAAQSVPKAEKLQSHLEEFRQWKAASTGEVDFEVKNIPFEDGNMTRVALVVEGVDLEEATTILATPDNWCELLFLHLNVKACVYNDAPDDQWVRLYMGRKFYQPPEKAEELQLSFESGTTPGGVSWAELSAEEGPYGTSDYYIGLFAIQAEDGVYTELMSSQKVGDAATAAQKLYFATLASNKVGFSVVGEDWRGNPEYVGGQQGALERNIVRYLLALEIFLQKHSLEGPAGLQERANDWYDATAQYKKQLHEVDKDDYLEDKAREYENQRALQSQINQARK